MRWTWAGAIGLAVLCAATPCVAAEEQPSGWQFEVMPYGWITGVFGTVQVKGRTAKLDVTLGDVLDALWDGDAFGGAAYLAARYDRWSVFADTIGGFVNVGASESIPTRFCTLSVAAKVKERFVLMDLAVGYQFGEWSLPERRRPISLGVYLGTRYEHLGVDIESSVGVVHGVQRSGSVSDSFNAAAPLIGVRWEVPVLDQLSLDFRGDLGGLPASSSLTWGLVGNVRYWLSWEPFGSQTWLDAGYRVLAFQRDFGGGKSYDLQLRGPLMGLGFQF